MTLARRLSSLALLTSVALPACVIGELPAGLDTTGPVGGAAGAAGAGAGAGQGGAAAGKAGASGGGGSSAGNAGAAGTTTAGAGGTGGAGGSAAGGGGTAGSAAGKGGEAGQSGAAGEGGATGGKAGAAGEGGSSAAGASGAAGAAGTAGSAGIGGSDAGAGGTAGSAGSDAGQGGGGQAGQGGFAGNAAGSAGTAGTTGGTAGAGGTAGSGGAAGKSGSGGGGPVSECLPSIVKDLVHWWPLDRDLDGFDSTLPSGQPKREVPDVMGRRYGWRGATTKYSSDAAAPGLFLPPQEAPPEASRFVIPNGDQKLQMLNNAFTVEWTMAFPAQGDSYIFFQPVSSASSTELVCVLGQQDQINCDINGGKLGWSINGIQPYPYAGQHHWALTYDRTAQKIALYYEGVALPAGFRSVTTDWNPKSINTNDLAWLGGDKVLHNVRIWNRALTATEVAREKGKGACSVAAPILFNALDKPEWPGTGGSPLPTVLFPLYDVEPGYSGYGQPPPGSGPRGGFNFTGTSGTNMPSVDITTARAFRLEHVSSYHDANDPNLHPNLTIVGELSLEGQTALLAPGYRELYRALSPATGNYVVGPVATPITMLPGSYKFRWRPENGPNSGSTQVAFPWVYMIGTRLE